MPSFSTPNGVLSLPVPLLIVMAIDPRPAQVNHLGASLPVFLQARTLLAVIGIRHARTAADNTSSSKGPVVALVADTHERVLLHEAVAENAATVTSLAHAPDGDTGLLPAHDQVCLMRTCHT